MSCFLQLLKWFSFGGNIASFFRSYFPVCSGLDPCFFVANIDDCFCSSDISPTAWWVVFLVYDFYVWLSHTCACGRWIYVLSLGFIPVVFVLVQKITMEFLINLESIYINSFLLFLLLLLWILALFAFPISMFCLLCCHFSLPINRSISITLTHLAYTLDHAILTLSSPPFWVLWTGHSQNL